MKTVVVVVEAESWPDFVALKMFLLPKPWGFGTEPGDEGREEEEKRDQGVGDLRLLLPIVDRESEDPSSETPPDNILHVRDTFFVAQLNVLCLVHGREYSWGWERHCSVEAGRCYHGRKQRWRGPVVAIHLVEISSTPLGHFQSKKNISNFCFWLLIFYLKSFC